jgi:hypothetical protein
MQYRLSTIFLVFLVYIVVATSLALFDATGIYVSLVLLLAGFCLYKLPSLKWAWIIALELIFFGIVYPVGKSETENRYLGLTEK